MKKARPLTQKEADRIKQMLLLFNIKSIEPATVQGAQALLDEIKIISTRIDEQVIKNKDKKDDNSTRA